MALFRCMGGLMTACALAVVWCCDGAAAEGDAFAEASFQDQLVTLMLQAEKRQQQKELMQPIGMPADSEVICYDGLGCFGKAPIGALPENPDLIKPQFKLYTKESGAKPAMVYSYNSKFGNESASTRSALNDSKRQLVFVAHGFGGHSDLDWMQKIREIKTTTPSLRANVILVDWKRGARYTTVYTGAAANSVLVGRMAAHLCVAMMRQFRIDARNVQFVGFSLGGQMSGFFAEEVYHRTGGQLVGKVTALDAASPLFESNDIVPRKEYAHFLEAIHTSAGNLLWRGKVGVERNFGHVDYYPNGGIDQPGCRFPNVSCSHQRAVDYYIEALASRGECLYSGFPCQSVEDAQRGDCHSVRDRSHFMSMLSGRARDAIFFLKTNATAPYCIRDYSI